jgi:hypothetical protein
MHWVARGTGTPQDKKFTLGFRLFSFLKKRVNKAKNGKMV